MAAWRDGMGLLLLTMGVGCGGALAQEQGPEEVLLQQQSFVAGESLACIPDAAGTQRVKTLLPPSQEIPRYAATPDSFADFQGTLYFAVPFEDGRRGLWKSDGTSAGTVAVKEFTPTAGETSRVLGELTAVSSRLFFQAGDVAHGTELWVSDGTTGGTRLVKDLTPGPENSYLDHSVAVGERLVFLRTVLDAASSSARPELWSSDGTAAGTVRLRDYGVSAEVEAVNARLGNALLFFVKDASGTALWKTDGTVGGTARLLRLDSGPTQVFDLRLGGGLAFFSLVEPDGDTEVWRTDGTAAGTRRLATYGSARQTRLIGVVGSSLYLTTTSLSTQYMVLNRLPVAGGSTTSIVTLPNEYASRGEAFPSVGVVSGAAGGRKIFFSVSIGSAGPAPRDTQLWVTDGTAAGTQLLRRPLSLSDEYGSPVLAVRDDLAFFSAYEAQTPGIEPWVTDGTAGGTKRLKDVAPGAESSYPRDFFRVGPRVYFSAFDDTQAGQLWSTTLPSTCNAP